MVKSIVKALALITTATAASANDDKWMEFYDLVSQDIPVISTALDKDVGAIGWYYPAEDVIVIEKALNDNPSKWWTTFIHESMHRIQDCHNGAKKPLTSLETLINSIDPSHTEYFKEFLNQYPLQAWPTELEAEYAAQYYSADKMLTMYRQHCVSAPEKTKPIAKPIKKTSYKLYPDQKESVGDMVCVNKSGNWNVYQYPTLTGKKNTVNNKQSYTVISLQIANGKRVAKLKGGWINTDFISPCHKVTQ